MKSPLLYDCTKDEFDGLSYSLQSVCHWEYNVSLNLPMYFSFENIALDKIIPAFQAYCRSVEERMIIVHENRCLKDEEIIPEYLSSENSNIMLKRAAVSMDALFYIPIQFTMTLCSRYTTQDMKRIICNGVYRLINETVEFSTSSGYSVM